MRKARDPELQPVTWWRSSIETPTKVLLVEDLLWGDLDAQERLTLLQQLLAQGAAAGAQIAVAPLMGYAETDTLRGAGFRQSRRLMHMYLTVWGGASRAGVAVISISGCLLNEHVHLFVPSHRLVSFANLPRWIARDHGIRWHVRHHYGTRATMLPCPMVTPGMIMALSPIQTLSSITIGMTSSVAAGEPDNRATGSAACPGESKIHTSPAILQCRPITILLPIVKLQAWPIPLLSPTINVGWSEKRAAKAKLHFPSI